MATDTEPLLVLEEPPDGQPRRARFRPVRPEWAASRLLRRFAGLREDVLDWVPEERPRYTRLGIIVANTGILAATSMLVALNNVTSVAWPWLLPFALLWGYIILSIDGSIVASTHGVYSGKWKIYIPRLVISLLIGAFVAEPLVLWFFRPAIVAEVGKIRAAELSAYEGRWVSCNPPNGTHPASCTGYLLNLPNSPTSVTTELVHEQQLLSSVQLQITAINNAIATLRYQARAECDGVLLPGAQTTGVIGEGPNCRQDRMDYTQYGPQHGLPGLLKLQGQYQAKISDLDQQLAESQSTYSAEVQRGIAQQLATWTSGIGKPGLLDEDRALQTLASQSSFVRIQEWLLRLLLIALDALPVLTKWFSRSTKYDILYSRQLEVGDREHEKFHETREHADLTALDLEAKETEYAYHDGLADMAQAARVGHGQREKDQQDAIEDLAAQLRAARRQQR
jgi:Domain of unknown function (DUF4407)